MADEFKNVRISVLKHFEDNLAVISSIHWPGTDFDTDVVTEWFQPRLLGPASGSARPGERDGIWTLNVNCFAKVGEDFTGAQLENIHRHWELADEVRGVFNQADVPVKNWAAGGDPIIAHLRFEEASLTQVSTDTKTQQIAVSIAARLIF